MGQEYILLIILLLVLIFLSAFFSGSETGMMALNRYRLRHLARHGNKGAKRIVSLLKRPDRLLGVILLGNTFANVLASSVATILAVHFFGEIGVFVATLLLTLFILLFAEIIPKTFAAMNAQKVAMLVSPILSFLLKLIYPVVWCINALANSVLKLFGQKVSEAKIEPLSTQEFQTLVNESSGQLGLANQNMLLGILELSHVTVADAMIPRAEVHGIDLNAPWDTIEKLLVESDHGYLPLYRDTLNAVEGVINRRKVLAKMVQKKISIKSLLKLAEPPYFVPEGAILRQQLSHFQQKKTAFGVVVDEYGDIQGILTLHDILEEIVGELPSEIPSTVSDNLVEVKADGSVLVDASLNIRDLNRKMNWTLPTDGPKTVSGLIIEYLEKIPTPGIGVRLAGYPIEILSIESNTIGWVRFWPALCVKADSTPE